MEEELNIETLRLRFRPWRDSDAETLFKYASDPEVGPRAGWPPHRSVEESLSVIRDIFSLITTIVENLNSPIIKRKSGLLIAALHESIFTQSHPKRIESTYKHHAALRQFLI